jgi:hypothetical protein
MTDEYFKMTDDNTLNVKNLCLAMKTDKQKPWDDTVGSVMFSKSLNIFIIKLVQSSNSHIIPHKNIYLFVDKNKIRDITEDAIIKVTKLDPTHITLYVFKIGDIIKDLCKLVYIQMRSNRVLLYSSLLKNTEVKMDDMNNIDASLALAGTDAPLCDIEASIAVLLNLKNHNVLKLKIRPENQIYHDILLKCGWKNNKIDTSTGEIYIFEKKHKRMIWDPCSANLSTKNMCVADIEAIDKSLLSITSGLYDRVDTRILVNIDGILTWIPKSN